MACAVQVENKPGAESNPPQFAVRRGRLLSENELPRTVVPRTRVFGPDITSVEANRLLVFAIFGGFFER
jgi:hypothetical protein